MDSVTVTDKCKESFNETDIQGYRIVSFMERKGQPMSRLSSICVVFGIVIHKLKEASLLKSSILILKRIHGRSMLY
jgi:hypothetical protein